MEQGKWLISEKEANYRAKLTIESDKVRKDNPTSIIYTNYIRRTIQIIPWDKLKDGVK